MVKVSTQRLEDQEKRALAPYALKSYQSRGTEYPDAEPEYRTIFQRDRDRVIHTTAFRRLEYKTQVFVNFEGDYYRTRLTHTLEVTQIGRSLARAIGANEDLVEVICLAHDLGHPPFGHAGESALNECMATYGGFEHNKQSYRIVTELERRYPNWPGLNLSFEAREGIVKHETEYDNSDTAGFGFNPSLRASLEAQIANSSDEMAYNAHDLDDGLRSGLLVPEQLAEVEWWQYLSNEVGYAGGPLTELMRHRLIRRMVGLQLFDVINTTADAIDAAGVQSPEEVQQLDHNLVGHSERFATMNRQFKTFLYENLYRHFRVVRMSRKARRFLQDLFLAYIEEPAQLPPSVREKFDERGQHRAVTDYIAGMTDRYALQEWERLFVPFERP
ncbi:MAG: deoxyguanosinetriphosphate triphosphohydrolase [Chloroflexi bacterium]|nr:deoxyguanosinetriphosphate triphosphohydrolase [Chloroflexota bacterium]